MIFFVCFVLLLFVFHHSYVFIVEQGSEWQALQMLRRGPTLLSYSFVTWSFLACLGLILGLLLIDSHVLRIRKLLSQLKFKIQIMGAK